MQVNLLELQQLVYALGKKSNESGRELGRNLHFADAHHLGHADKTILYSPMMLEAYKAGNYQFFVSEGTAPEQTNFASQNVTILNPDNRVDYIVAAIRNESPAAADAFLNNPHYLDVWQYTSTLKKNGEPLNPQQASALQTLMAKVGGFGPETQPQAMQHFRIIEKHINALATSPALNGNILTDIKTKREENPEANFGLHFGDWHTETLDTADSAIDMDGKNGLRGYKIGFADRESDIARHNREYQDKDDFILVIATGKIHDNRPKEAQIPTLATLLAEGKAFTPTQSTVDIGNASVIPASDPTIQTALNTIATGQAEPEQKDEGFKLENLPWWHIAGAALGAWFASGIGGGIWNIVSMAIGAFLGTSLLGSIGANIAKNEAETPNANALTNDSTAHSLNALAVLQTPASSLAFAKVASVQLPVADADRSQWLESPSIERIAPAVTSLIVH